MGTRVLYQIMGEIDGEKKPVCILYSNSSHGSEDPQSMFRDIVRASMGPTNAVEMMLGERYRSNDRNHMKGDRMFSIVTNPFGDYEFSLAVDFDAEDREVYLIERPENTSPKL